jgi:replication factor A1
MYRVCVVISYEVVKQDTPLLMVVSAPAPVKAEVSNSVPVPPVRETYGGQPAAAPEQAYGGVSSTVPPAAPAAPVGSANWTGGYGANKSTSGNNKPVVQEAFSSQQVTPIHALNPYSNRWTIKARITSKGEVKSWDNAKGKGTLFSINLIDASKSEIRCTFFKEACTKFYPILEEGGIYYFQSGKLKPVQNRQYSNIKCDYEITFDMNSSITAAPEDVSISENNFDFVKINTIADLEPGTTIDLVAVVKSATEVSTLQSKKQGGKEMYKRDLTVMDDSLAEIRLTLWGATAQDASYEWASQPLVGFKGVKIGDYGGRSLSLLHSGTMVFAPDHPDATALRDWVLSTGGLNSVDTVVLSSGGGSLGKNDTFENRALCQSIKDDGLGFGDKPDWRSMKLTPFYIKSDQESGPWYTACSQGDCKKKVIEDLSGAGYRCETCGVTMTACTRRYILSTQMCDHSGSNWFSLFDNEAKLLLGKSADELYEIKQQPDGGEDKYNEIVQAALFKQIVVKAKVKAEDVQGEMRVKVTVQSLSKVIYQKECSDMIEAIAKYQTVQ